MDHKRLAGNETAERWGPWDTHACVFLGDMQVSHVQTNSRKQAQGTNWGWESGGGELSTSGLGCIAMEGKADLESGIFGG